MLSRLGSRTGNAFYKAVEHWRVERPTVVDKPLLLVSQIQRSGGTLLSQLFDGHPQCLAHPQELMWGRPDKEYWPQVVPETSTKALFAALDQDWIAKMPPLAEGGGYRKGPKSDVMPFVYDNELCRRVFTRRMEVAPPASRREILDAYLTGFFNAWVDCQFLYASGVRYVSAFIPRVHMTPGSLEGFFVDYPEGFLITVVRHPASWYSSVIHHHYLERYGSIAAILDLWSASVQASIDAAQHFDHAVLITFQDLVQQPEATLRKICLAAGLDFHPALLSPSFNTMPIRSNSNYEAVLGIDPGVHDRYLGVLEPESIAVIESRCGELYEKALAAKL